MITISMECDGCGAAPFLNATAFLWDRFSHSVMNTNKGEEEEEEDIPACKIWRDRERRRKGE